MTSSPPAAAAARSRPDARRTKLALAYGQTVLALDTDDAAAASWLAEFLGPWFAPTGRPADCRVTLSGTADLRRELAVRCPPETPPRACFALDQQVVALPAWRERHGIAVSDAERACLFVAAPARIDLLADRASRRPRFTLQWVFHEIAATRLRRTALDLHAAAVERGGSAILIVGPKRAGKTTLSFHLLRSGRCRWITNDRAFVDRDANGFAVRGMPTPVKLLAPTLRSFPELRRGLRAVERPYLHALDEVVGDLDEEPNPAPAELALSPAQVAYQLGVRALEQAPLGAIVFPEIRADVAGVAAARLDPTEAAARLRSNRYGRPSARREATLFEELDGGWAESPRELADELSACVPAYAVTLGPDAYDGPDFAARLVESVHR